MPVALTRSALFGMRNGDQVVDKIDRPNLRIAHPATKCRIVKPGVTDVKIVPAFALPARASAETDGAFDQPGPKLLRGLFEQLEEQPRLLAIEDAPEPAMLDDCLRLARIAIEIGEADSVDASRLTADPAAPNQTGYVEQQWSVVGQGPS